jgi:hypothetical protein
LQKEFVVSNSFLVEFLESLSYRLILPANWCTLTSSFHIWILFIFLALVLLLWLGIPKL